MKAQEVFDKVVNHLRQQKVPAINKGGCSYRTANGLKCAVGCLIDDSDYHSWMEGMGLDGILEHSDLLSPPLDSLLSEHRDLLVMLQVAHDINANFARGALAALELQWINIAKKHNLIYTPPS